MPEGALSGVEGVKVGKPMIAIQSTQKLLKELGQEYKEAVIPTFPLGCWHANLLTLDRRKCVLFTNDLTRYSFLVPGLRKPDFKVLDEVFRQNLFRCLLSEGISQEKVEMVLDEIREVVFTRTGSRSILGTMNDIVYHFKMAVYDAGGLLNTDISNLNRHINRMPIGALEYRTGVEKLTEALA